MNPQPAVPAFFADPGLACLTGDPEIFFPEPGGDSRGTEARRICGRCHRRKECLEWAVTSKIAFGFWGGSSPAERRDMRAGRLDIPRRAASQGGGCGTNGGYHAHRNAVPAEDACGPCLQAHNTYQRSQYHTARQR